MNSPQDLRPTYRRTTIAVAIAIVIVVASSIALAVLTIMHHEEGTHDGPSATYSKAPISGGLQVNIASLREARAWDSIRVQLSDGTNFWEWKTNTSDLDGGSAITFNYGPKTIAGLTVWLNVTDAGGNGFVNSGDHFTVTANPAFSSTVTYTAVLVDTDRGEKIGTGIFFTG